MTSGGARARSGPAPDPMSYRSLDREWVELPAHGYDGIIPEFPLADPAIYRTITVDGERVRELDEEATAERISAEGELWTSLWRKPQGAAWSSLDLAHQVASYTRAFLESNDPGAPASLKTAVLRMEDGLGISVNGMRANLWKIASTSNTSSTTPGTTSRASKGSRKTGGASWLSAVRVEGA